MKNADWVLSHNESEESQDEECSDTNVQNITDGIGYEDVISIKCAAHTLQLAVKDFLAEQNQTLIGKARELTKLLRSASFRFIIENLGVPKPSLDVPTRWSSTFTMLKGILEIKDFCLENDQISRQLKSEEWVQIETLVAALKPAHILTLRLQSSQLLLGDFYKAWLEMVLELQSKENETSKLLVKCINIRQSTILENNTMYSALFLDPRIRRVLSREKIERAKKHLKNIILQMDNVEQMSTASTLPLRTSETKPLLLYEGTNQSSSSKLRTGLLGMEASDASSDDEETSVGNSVRKAFFEIDNYKEKRIDVDADIIEYWESKKFIYPRLSDLACIVHQVPATQVSVERAFSALKMVLSDLRYNLSEQNLAALLMVKLNSETEL